MKLDWQCFEVKKSTTLKDGTMKWCGSLNRPGFYRFKVIAHVDGKGLRRDFAPLVSTPKISAFRTGTLRILMLLEEALDEVKKNGLNPTKVKLLPERCTKIRMYMKSVITTTDGALRCMAS